MRNRRRRFLVTTYVPLVIFALVTLISFVYLMCSAIKPKSVFFSSPFIPDDGLFVIDQSTGELSLFDITLLENPPADGVYEISVAVKAADGEPVGRTILVGTADATRDDLNFVIPADVEINQSLGRVEPPAELAGQTGLSYRVAEGNPHGMFGRAWGLLTLDNFDRLFTGVPVDDDGDGSPERFRSTGVWRAIVNSFFFASVSSVLATLGAAMGGYALAKFRFRFRGLIDNVVLAALVIPGALLIAPSYQLLYWLGLLDTYAGLILPGIAPAFGVYLFRQAFITSLPDEMMEASRIDGCGEIRLFFTMALPMARPMVGAFLLITYLGAWNNFIGPQIILQTPEKFPLAVWISQLRGVYSIDYGLIMAGTLVAIAPVLVLFLMLQKEFIAGLTAGAVKG